MSIRRVSKRRSTRDLNDRCYWRYISYDHSDLELYQLQCKNSSNLSYQQYLKHIEGLFSIYLHPNFKKWTLSLPTISQDKSKDLLKYEADNQQVREAKQIQFNSVMVDDITFKILGEIVSIQNVVSYTFVNNEFSDSNLMSLIDIIDINNHLRKLSFHYNKNKIIRLLSIGNFKNIVYLSLKSNNIIDKCIQSLVENITSAPVKLRYLDLHDNKITKEGIVKLAKIMEAGNLQYIGLGKNQLTSIDDIKPILEFTYMNELQEAEKEQYCRTLGDKKLLDEMLGKKKKPLKRLLDLKVPTDIVDIDGVYYRIKKPSLSLISLIDNGFKQSHQELIPIVSMLNKRMELVLSLNKYTEETLSQLKKFENIKL